MRVVSITMCFTAQPVISRYVRAPMNAVYIYIEVCEGTHLTAVI